MAAGERSEHWFDNEHPSLRKCWHPVAWAHELSEGEILPVELLGERWCVARLGDRVAALRDECPHRRSPLSAGSIVGDTVQCAYHGYRFAADGRCVEIPAIDPSLLTRLHIKLGDTLRVGEATLQARATIVREPDRAVTFMTAGPRVMIAAEALAVTQLVQTGSLGEYVYNLRLNGAETAEATRERLMRAFPKADWRLRGLNQAAQGLDIFLDNVTLFLTLVGLTALLTGGIGVANAVRAHLGSQIGRAHV